MSQLFGKTKVPEQEQIDPSKDARERRLRIAGRGGEASTLLSKPGQTQGNIFKRNLGGTGGGAT